MRGKTIVEATSEGLEPARITITFKGGEEYKEGVTPIVERPYKRYVRERGRRRLYKLSGETILLLAATQMNILPAWLPMEIFGLIGRLQRRDKSPFWTVNTEKGLQLKGNPTAFPR